MAYMQIPKVCGAIGKDGKFIEKELPVNIYKLYIHSCSNNRNFTLYELEQDNDQLYTNYFEHTGKEVTFDVLTALRLFSDFRKYHFANLNLWNKNKKSDKTDDDIKELSELHSITIKYFLEMSKNPVFINNENQFYSSMADFENNFNKIEKFFCEDRLSEMSLTELEKTIKYFFNAELNVDYIPVGNKVISEFTDLSEMPKRTVYEYTCKTVYDVFFAIVHYCKLTDLKLKSCKLCHTFFFADNLKEQYCTNSFSYVDWENKTHTFPQCAGKTGARKKIWDKLQAKKIKIYKWLAYHPRKQAKFGIECSKIECQARDNPSIENLQIYERFLYIDCDKYHKKYERANKK